MTITNGLELIEPSYYGKHGAPHDVWTRLRNESPIHYCEPIVTDPFWAITRHADICEISKRPLDFLNSPGIVIVDEIGKKVRQTQQGLAAMRTIIEMDPPEHRDYRKVASPWFTPRALRRLDRAIDQSARDVVDKLAGTSGEGECDFAIDVAAAHPLRILSTILGVPQEREADILRLTNQLFGADDPDLRREGDRETAIMELGMELFQLFNEIIEDRRKNPRDDLATVLANGRVKGELMGPMETFGYYLITFTAGHDTTKNALAGGMRVLMDNPEQLDLLRREPERAPDAVEEIVRWTSPVNYMKRTAARDVELGSHKFREGEELVLFYASANRDDAVFDEPFRFRIDRRPNPHLGFGIGEHFCLGANLARRSQVALFKELCQRLEEVEYAGEPEQISASFVVGLKRLPIRYKIRPSS